MGLSKDFGSNVSVRSRLVEILRAEVKKESVMPAAAGIQVGFVVKSRARKLDSYV